MLEKKSRRDGVDRSYASLSVAVIATNTILAVHPLSHVWGLDRHRLPRFAW